MKHKLSKKERAEIYLDAAMRIDDHIDVYCCCAMDEIIQEKYNIDTNNFCETAKIFDEFLLFNPNMFLISGAWWKEYDQQQERVLALLFSRAMALNP